MFYYIEQKEGSLSRAFFFLVIRMFCFLVVLCRIIPNFLATNRASHFEAFDKTDFDGADSGGVGGGVGGHLKLLICEIIPL